MKNQEPDGEMQQGEMYYDEEPLFSCYFCDIDGLSLALNLFFIVVFILLIKAVICLITPIVFFIALFLFVIFCLSIYLSYLLIRLVIMFLIQIKDKIRLKYYKL